MTKQKQLEAIRKEVISCVPEIVELEFGCRISRPYEMYRRGGVIIGQDNGTFYVLYDGLSQVIESIHDIQDREIIGKDITLEDVLKALNAYSPNAGTLVDTIFVSIICMWEMGDPLHLQSKETVEFLYNLICKKNNVQ